MVFAPFSDRHTPLILLLVCGLAYGLLFAWQGFYWDDFPLMWIAETYGLAGLARYFSTNRPFWGLFFQASNALLGEQPWQWQLFGLFWRWVSTVTFWLFLKQLWPRQAQAAALAALALLVYPGFGQQPIGMVYGHFFLIMAMFFFSLYAGLRALRSAKQARIWTVGALLASFINLITLEYFFVLELARPLVYGLALTHPASPQRLMGRTLRAWLPYLLLFSGVVIWRVFFFEFQSQNYSAVGLDALRADPISGGLVMLGRILTQIGRAGVAAWVQPFLVPDLAGLGRINTVIYVLVSLAGIALVFWLLVSLRENAASQEKGSGVARQDGQILPGQTTSNRGTRPGPFGRVERQTGLQMLAVGAFLLLIAGAPFYLTGLPVRLGFPNDRFTLPFMPGSALVLTGLLYSLPLRKNWPRLLVAGLLLGLAVGYHFANSTAYRRDWNLQKAFFWQLSWRVPGLVPGTTLVSNDLPLRFYSDNSLTAPLNWIYAPENRTQAMDYMFFYTSVRWNVDSWLASSPGLPIEVDYLAATFSGSTDQVVVLYYQPPACLRVLDGQIEKDNQFLPVKIRTAAANLGSSAWILPEPATPAIPPRHYYGLEPARGWCYYYLKADLARQVQDWERVAALGDQAFDLGDYPNDPAERLPFIEGYAHLGRWQDALEQTRLAGQISPAIRPVLCRLWQRIDPNTAENPGKQEVIQQLSIEIPCAIENHEEQR